jgi:hypothetical protein
MRSVLRILLLSRHTWSAFALLCLAVTGVHGEPLNPGASPPEIVSFAPGSTTKPQKIFLFTDTTPTENVKKQKQATASSEEPALPAATLTNISDTAVPDKPHKIFLFTNFPDTNTKTPDPTSVAKSKKAPALSPSFNQATQKKDSDSINAVPVSSPTTEPAKNPVSSDETPDFYFADTPPKGFEYLTAAQTTEVDIYFGDEMITSTMARFDLTSIEFINPQEITALLTQLKEPEAITSAISGTLNPHTEDLCLNKLQRNCGELKPSIADIIFDANRFRVDLFINPLYLNVKSLQPQIFLPPPEKTLSSVNIFSAQISGSNGLGQRSYLTSNSIISYGTTRLLSRARLHNTDGLTLETTSLEHDRGKWTYTAGTMESTSYVSSLAATQGFLGLRAARTLNTRTDLRLSKASSIFVFFNERSYVEILRDGKVLDSGFYEFGNQQINTSQLPEGVYNIILRITNSRGEELQTHLFSRSSLLPPQDHALHFLEAGMLLEKNKLGDINKAPKASNVSFIHTGSRVRLTDRFGADLEALNTSEKTALVQAGLYYFMPGLFLHGGALGGSEHTQGQFFDLSFSHRQFSLSLFYRDLETNQTETEKETNSTYQSGTRTGLTFGTRILGGSLFARATETSNTDIAAEPEYSLNFRRSLFRRGGTLANLTLDWTSNQGNDTMAIGLQITSSSNTHHKSLATRWSNSGDHSTLQTEGRFTRFHRHNGELYGSTTVSALTEKDHQSLGLHLKGDSRYGNGYLKTQHQRYANNSSDNTTYSAGAQAVVITGASALALGGSKPGRAGIIVDLNGQSEEDFEVHIGNRRQAMASKNRNQPVLLPPYHSYDVTLKSTGDNLVRFDAKPQTVTLYPGNVTHLQWDVDPVFVVIGQAIYADGKAVGNTRITNLEEFSGTDENGWFQVELSKMKTLELAPAKGPACKIQLPEQSEYEEVIVFDQLVCDSEIQTTSSL